MMKTRRLKPRYAKALLVMSLVPVVLAAGCARETQTPLTSQPPAQMEQKIQQNAQNYAAYKAAHPNPPPGQIPNPQGGQ